MSSFDSATLPENIRKCMAPESRQELRCPTMPEIAEKTDRLEELEMHKQLEAWCRINRVVCYHCRTDRKATIQNGLPDFGLMHGGHGCCIELKGPTGKLSAEQEKKQQEVAESDTPCLTTSDLKEAIDFARKHLKLPPAH